MWMISHYFPMGLAVRLFTHLSARTSQLPRWQTADRDGSCKCRCLGVAFGAETGWKMSYLEVQFQLTIQK